MRCLTRNKFAVLFALAATLAGAGRAYDESSFEVASIKLSDPVSTKDRVIHWDLNGHFVVTRIPLRSLIGFAWNVSGTQVVGGAPWVAGQYYEISAKAGGDTSEEQIRLLVQNLLKERFQLAVHKESREALAYTLAAGKTKGSGLTESPTCDASDAPKAGGLACEAILVRRNYIEGRSATIAQLVDALSRVLGRPVVDKTGLAGKYNLRVDWIPDETQAALGAADRPQAPDPVSTGPSIYQAIREQLGLTLESHRTQVDVLVVDHAQKASEN